MGQQGFIQLPIFHCTEQGDRMKSIRIGHHLLAGKHPKNTEMSSRLSQIIPLCVSIGLSCWADGVCVLCRKQVNVLKDTEENRTNWISGLNFTCMKDNWSHHICQAKAARRLLQQAQAQGRKDRSCMEALINTKKKANLPKTQFSLQFWPDKKSSSLQTVLLRGPKCKSVMKARTGGVMVKLLGFMAPQFDGFNSKQTLPLLNRGIKQTKNKSMLLFPGSTSLT